MRNPDGRWGDGERSARRSDAAAPHAPGRLAPLELWAGLECTVNRVGDRYFDQVERGGHDARADDMDRLASLGARAVRVPVLWERVAPHGLTHASWRATDERLARLRALGVRPIVGLVHHGSGPRETSLVDPAFPEKLARFAHAVAERYPWVEDFTPVNEPLTTARFSGLYGLWYPHGRDDRTFVRAFRTQLRAIRLAMEAIRDVTPGARLVQTEDLGECHATPELDYQARFENERRWLTYDLLCGRAAALSPLMQGYLLGPGGLADAELAELDDLPCAPDVLGVNHYLTSERFLDARLERYPPHTHGGNHRQRYADVEAVRVCASGVAGPEALLRATWERYHRPLAVTEAHLGCTREQQLRWLAEVWGAAERLRDDGCDVRAVTLWSAFGAYDWVSLLTRDDGHYEPGAFDVRSSPPRPTALARMARDLAAGGAHDHPALDGEGWWRIPSRFAYEPVHSAGRGMRAAECGEGRPGRAGTGHIPRSTPRPLLITGATGTLGRALARACTQRGLAFQLLSRRELDIADAASVRAALDHWRPWAVVNAAGYVRVDDAERDVERCRRENAHGPALLAAACAARGVAFVTFSSDLVFDGARETTYVESDRPAPLNVYGASKAEAEARVLAAHPGALVARTSAFFGPDDDHNFVTQALGAIAAGLPWPAASDAVISPTYVPDLCDAALDLLVDGESGIWHLANTGATTWAELARRVAERAGLDESLVVARPMATFDLPARRPQNSALSSERAAGLLPPLDDAIRRYLDARPPRRPDRSALVAAMDVGEEDPDADAVGAGAFGDD
ncbi:MAG TPA: family 1 glycosylhydrolase [Gemmatimonadaceae bacterium]|nr:family 1 glycosylhydrolase [Gemmatimonadaceae bacterium]